MNYPVISPHEMCIEMLNRLAAIEVGDGLSDGVQSRRCCCRALDNQIKAYFGARYPAAVGMDELAIAYRYAFSSVGFDMTDVIKDVLQTSAECTSLGPQKRERKRTSEPE